MSGGLDKIGQNFYSHAKNGAEIGDTEIKTIETAVANYLGAKKDDLQNFETELIDIDIKDDLNDEKKEGASINDKINTIINSIAKAPNIIESIIEKENDNKEKAEDEIATKAKETALKLKDLIYSTNDSRYDQIYELLSTEADAVNFDLIVEEYKNLTGGRDLNEDLGIIYKYHPFKKGKLNKLLSSMLSFKDSNSQVKNKYYKGDKFKIERQGSIFTITNKNTQETRQIDLKVLLKNFPDAEDRRKLLAQLQELPGEVLMDIAAEQTSFMPLEPEVKGAGAYYRSNTDAIYVNPDGQSSYIIHELGHSIDHNKANGDNRSVVYDDAAFVDYFNAELQEFLNQGNKRYEFNSEPPSPSSTYATVNEGEMFAECYTFLMGGYCGSAETIVKYFPRTLEYVKTILVQNRGEADSIRH